MSLSIFPSLMFLIMLKILGQLGWPDNLAVMIGNDLEEDIRPASILGLPTYWITNKQETPEFNRHSHQHAGQS